MKTLNNKDYFGYSGGRWIVIIVLMQRERIDPTGPYWKWIEDHPFEVNAILARQFKRIVDKQGRVNGLRTWQHGPMWKKDKKLYSDTEVYVSKVKSIFNSRWGAYKWK